MTKLDTTNVLTLSEERAMLERHKGNREKINHELIIHNEKLVLTFAHKYAHAANYDDLVQEGMVGLAEAAKRFDVNRNVKFSCYAYMYIKKYVLQFIYSKIRHDTISEDGETNMVSMNYHVGGDREGTELENILKVREDYVGVSPSSVVQSSERSSILYRAIENIDFNEEEKAVLERRILSSEKMKLRELADSIGCSISNIKAIEYRIHNAIRQELARMQIHSFSDINPE